MTFAELAVVCGVGIAGPLLALPRRWQLPVVLGELLAGIVLGRTGFGYLDAGDPTFAFLGDLGFALVMFVAGSHVPVRDPRLRPALRVGLARAVVVGVVAAGAGALLAAIAGTHHAPLYAVLMASSSAAVILPVVGSLGLGGPQVLALLPQVAVADAACIVALPLAIDPAHALRAAVGAVAVVAAGVVVFVLLRSAERSGRRHQVHEVSEVREFALELRVSLMVLFAVAALAVWLHVSIMLAGFACGIAVAGVGEPRRVAKQLFALTEGFLGPLFFVWLGAGLHVRDLASHPSMTLLGLALGLGAVGCHLLTCALRAPVPLALLSAAQLGVPVAAVAIGNQQGLFEPGEGTALVLGALVSIAAAVVGANLAARAGLREATP
ncbi:cation:proton antiporter [Nocardioides mangrovicus]|uniref:Cation:proton antiporter n=1 Tax=Nocardioides mangrovicus TaxID=2478913 RepID=A0A3L8NYG4_9ACTN|nr:cation:proton antiporter [Nocardioides mangrovicus]RLV48210.1 cation:proton antiporter [Nocardioides mangrovicus]